MPFAFAGDGQKIYYEVYGEEGPWVVLIQGLSLPGRFWFDLPSTLARRNTCRVLVPDARGTGESGFPLKPWTMATMADDTAAAMRDAGVDKAVVFGVSMGGMVAQELALRHQPMVQGLILMSTTAGIPNLKIPDLETIGLLLRSSANGEKWVKVNSRLLLTPKYRGRTREILAGWPEAIQKYAPGARTFAYHLIAVLRHSTGSRLARISCPTLVITGDMDVLIPPENSHRLAGLIPGVEFWEIAEEGHGLPITRPGTVLKAINHIWARIASIESSAQPSRIVSEP